MDHKVTTDYTRLLANANVKVRSNTDEPLEQQLSVIFNQVYVRARPCADGQEPPEDMFERKKDSSKNIVIKVHMPTRFQCASTSIKPNAD